MKPGMMTRGIVVASLAYVGLMALSLGPTETTQDEITSGLGDVDTLGSAYDAWKADYVANGGDRRLTIALGAAKGLATGADDAYGRVTMDLLGGNVSVTVSALPEGDWDVWLIENRPAPDRTVLPEPGDQLRHVGRLQREGDAAMLEASLGSGAFDAFEPDLITVTRAGSHPTNDRLLVGTASLFQRVYRSEQRGRTAELVAGDDAGILFAQRKALRGLLAFISPTAYAQIGPNPNPRTALERLIVAGRRSFFNDTFGGNGRTCGTCHREEQNLAIDAGFIATLPPNDPLFVAEFNPDLMCDDPEGNTGCRFENPILMREFGLILENQDGFDDMANKFNMRSVPHTLAMLQNTLSPANVLPFPDGTTLPPTERTGWSGDGAPNGGTLREFIVGAVVQHYPKRLNRQAGVDFVLPTVAQMDAIEAFMRSVGRRQDLVLTGAGALQLRSEVAAKGQALFNDPAKGKCFGCHLNAGASVDGLRNANFDTGVAKLPSQPADLLVPPQPNPPDGGFGTTPTATGFGNGTFNTPPLVEAADTAPFFHNNAIATIEGAVTFYNSPTFNASPGAAGLAFLTGSPGPGINLDATEIEAIAAFLRVINTLENLRSAKALVNRIKIATLSSHLRELADLTIAELEDASSVLKGAGLHPSAQAKIDDAIRTMHAAKILPGRNSLLLSAALKRIDDSERELRQ